MVLSFIVFGAALIGTVYHARSVIAFNSAPSKIIAVHREPEDVPDCFSDSLLMDEDREEYPLSDLVYRDSEQSIDVKAGSKLTVTIPKSIFGEADKLTVVLYDRTRKREVTAENLYNNDKVVFSYRIEEEGKYSFYAVPDNNGKKEYRDLREFTVIETSMDIQDCGKVIPL